MSTLDLDGYTPSESEDFMNEKQRAYFRAKLEAWKDDILSGSKTTISNLREESANLPDLVDRASAESDKALELRTRDRQRKLISKSDAALRRTAIASTLASRSRLSGWKRVPPQRSASRPRRPMSAASASFATIRAQAVCRSLCPRPRRGTGRAEPQRV